MQSRARTQRHKRSVGGGAHEIGSFAKPEQIRFTDSLPKTRSGKIMRRLLREIVTSNSVTGDVTTLEDLSVVTRLAAQQDEE